MNDKCAEVADHLTVAIVDGINSKNAAAVQSGKTNNYKPIDVQEVIDIYLSIYRALQKEL